MPDCLKDLDETRLAAQEYAGKLNQNVFIFRETSKAYQCDRLWIDTRPLHQSSTRFTMIEEVQPPGNAA